MNSIASVRIENWLQYRKLMWLYEQLNWTDNTGRTPDSLATRSLLYPTSVTIANGFGFSSREREVSFNRLETVLANHDIILRDIYD